VEDRVKNKTKYEGQNFVRSQLLFQWFSFKGEEHKTTMGLSDMVWLC
jgi:hypothetical protein